MCLHLCVVTYSGGNNAKNSTKMKIGKGKANHDNPQFPTTHNVTMSNFLKQKVGNISNFNNVHS
jgi:hypothetical protein